MRKRTISWCSNPVWDRFIVSGMPSRTVGLAALEIVEHTHAPVANASDTAAALLRSAFARLELRSSPSPRV